MIIRALVLGWKLDVIESNSNPLQNITKQYDFSAMVPLQLQNSIDKLNQIKKLIVGGGVVSYQLESKLQKVSTEVFATYGMTETCTHIAVKKLNNFTSLLGRKTKQLNEESSLVGQILDDNLDKNVNHSFSRSYFTSLLNVTIYKDHRNCLVIDAPKISSEIIFTNDVVTLISDTQFEWLGRFDNVINSGGVKLHPEKIEEKLSKIIQERFFVLGITDEKLGEKLALIIELDSDTIIKFKKLLKAEIIKSTLFSKFEIPREIYFVDVFVETKTGKIQRKETLKLI
jgi:O-succinylbenzoic acid--CoA ligase